MYWRQDFSRENVCETLASPGQPWPRNDANLHRAQEEAGTGHAGRGGRLAKGVWYNEVWGGTNGGLGPSQKSCTNANPVLEFCLLDSFAFPRMPYKWEHTLHSF